MSNVFYLLIVIPFILGFVSYGLDKFIKPNQTKPNSSPTPVSPAPSK